MASLEDSDELVTKRRCTWSNSATDFEANKNVYPLDDEENVSTSYAKSSLVTIYVGPKKDKYMIHNHLLVEKSSYFKKVLETASNEEQTLEATLTEDLVPGFDRFVAWIYEGKVAPVGIAMIERQSAIEAWMLADRWCMPDLQNSVLEAFKRYHARHVIDANDILYLCQLGLGQSHLGIYMFDQLASNVTAYHDTYFGGEFPLLRPALESLVKERPELMVRLVETVCDPEFEHGDEHEPAKDKGCKYHVHPPGHHLSNCTAKLV